MNFKTFWKSRGFKSWFCAFIPVFALLLTVCLLLTCNSFLYQTLNSTVLGGERRVLKEGDASKYQYYTADYENKEEVYNAANVFNEEISEEGIVLLKNDDNTLPVAKESKITVFGKNSADIVRGGSGSNANAGGDVVRTVYDSLDSADISYNPEMKKFYEDDGRSGSGRPQSPSMDSSIRALTGFPTGETPAEKYDETVRNSWKEYGDMALVVISRIGGEGFDLPRTMFWDGSEYQNWDGDTLIPGARNKDDHYLQLDQNETDMIKTAAENFDKVVIVLNSPTPMELGFLDDPTHYAYSEKIGACLWIGTPGNTGIMALGRVLTGDVNPSGRTVDTYARDFRLDPTWNNFGNNLKAGGNQYKDKNGEARNAYFVHYVEGIYIGYRYYETRGFEEEEAGNGGWYDDNVVYPFGYGLSYTEFTHSITSVSQSGTLDIEKPIEVTVKVENAEDYAGKDVVQLYYSAPYTGGIEKSHVVLGDFAKTPEIAPDGSAEVTLSIDPRDMASYDYSDANGNHFSGYELEKGTYMFYVAENAHDRSLSFSLELTAPAMFDKDEVTETEIKNLFDDVSSRIPEYTSRSDFAGTFPQSPTEEMMTLSDEDLAAFNATYTDNAVDPWYTSDMPSQSTVELTRDDTTVKLYDLIGRDYGDGLWDDLLDQLTVDQMRTLIEIGNYHTEAIESIDKPLTTDPDGPMGYSLFMGNTSVYDTCYYASESLVGSTWSKDIARRFGVMIGNESLIGNERGDGRTYSGWYAPAVNLHRSPFSGRNFEYYSEDPVLSAQMAVNVIKGAMSKGVYCYLKHCALNDQETNRDSNGIAVWANEQSMRELYFPPFEEAVKEGGTTAMMSSFNRIGFTWAGGSYDLLTRLLRDEWGFEGMVVTDYNLQAYMNLDQMIRAGGDLNLSQAKSLRSYDSATAVSAIRQAAKNILFTVANSNAMNGMGEGNVWGYARPIWFIVMWTMFAVITAGLLVWGFFVCRKVVVAYRAGVRAGTIVPQKREKDPNYKPTLLSRIFLGAVAAIAVAGMVTSAVMMSTPPPSDSVPQIYAPQVRGITVTLDNAPIEDNSVTVELGGTERRLTVSVDTYGTVTGGVTYVSSDKSVAEVTADGIIKAKAAGDCSITVSVNADPDVSDTVYVKVVDNGTSAAYRTVTVSGGWANITNALPGTTVLLTPETREGMTFTRWEFDTEVTATGNIFVMPDSDVTVTAVFAPLSYNVTLVGAHFADSSQTASLPFGSALPTDITFDTPLDKTDYLFGWTDENGSILTAVPARDVTLTPFVLTRKDQLTMAANGYDYGTGVQFDGTSGTTTIGDDSANTVTLTAGHDMLRIKSGGVNGGDSENVYVTIVLRNDSDFAVTLKYEIEFNGTVWGPEAFTLEAGETVTIGITVSGLASSETPYHRIIFPDGSQDGATISYCGFLMQAK